MRPSRRQPDELRSITLERAAVKVAEGSCFVKFGDTHVLVTATLEDRLPPWLKGQARGWITAEYGMLPRATLERTRREATGGRQSGRTLEIQRLIGRSLRAVVELEAMGERQVTVDCDVIQADGGTRTAAITGAWIALHDCLAWMKTREMLRRDPLRGHVAAVSCGIFNGTPVLDLDYAEDSEADTDANFIMTDVGRRARPAGARGDRHELSRKRAHQGASGRGGVGARGVRGRFRARGRCARRRARHPLGALGGAREGFSLRHGEDRRHAARTPCGDARRAAGALRLRDVRRVAGRAPRGIRGDGRRHAGLAAARAERIRLRPDVPARRPHPDVRRDA